MVRKVAMEVISDMRGAQLLLELINGSDLEKSLKHIGSINDIEKFIKEFKVEEIIIAIESSEHESLRKIINLLEDTNVIIKILPDMYDILSGSVKMNAIFGAPLIEIYPSLMPTWQRFAKRAFDISFSTRNFAEEITPDAFVGSCMVTTGELSSYWQS